MFNLVRSPAALASHLGRLAARLGRALGRAMTVHRTRRALHGLPDHLLSDIGLARCDIDFVAGALVDRRPDPTRDPAGWLNRAVAAAAR